jgi:hypothetical protein
LEFLQLWSKVKSGRTVPKSAAMCISQRTTARCAKLEYPKMAQLMLINPRRRRRTKARINPRRRRTVAKRRVYRNPTNPHRRAYAKRRTYRNPVRAIRRRSRARRNPALRATGVMNDIMQAAIGATGAIGINYIYDMLPLPMAMKTGFGAAAGKAGAAVLLGMFARPMLGRAAGTMAQGALVVIAYDMIRSMLPPAGVPAVAGLGYTSPAIQAGYLPQQGMGEYVPAFSSGMGEYVYGAR